MNSWWNKYAILKLKYNRILIEASIKDKKWSFVFTICTYINFGMNLNMVDIDSIVYWKINLKN